MERGYNECSMSLINQGMEKGVEIGTERVRLECGMNAVLEAGSTVSAAARACRVDVAKLAKYIESHLMEVLIQVRGLTMGGGYNEYTMAFINQGIEMGIEKGLAQGLEQGEKIGQEKASLDCGAKAVERNMATVSEAAEAFGVDEAKLADYIESRKYEPAGELLGRGPLD